MNRHAPIYSDEKDTTITIIYVLIITYVNYEKETMDSISSMEIHTPLCRGIGKRDHALNILDEGIRQLDHISTHNKFESHLVVYIDSPAKFIVPKMDYSQGIFFSYWRGNYSLKRFVNLRPATTGLRLKQLPTYLVPK